MNIAVIFAGGIGSRMKSKTKPKQFLSMHGKPIIIHTLEVFDNNDDIDAIVIACVSDWIDYLKDIVYKYRINKVRKIVPGGSTCQLSIYNGLLAASDIAWADKDTIVLIHDGVRPLITKTTISDNIESVKMFGSAITCVEAKETIIVTKNDVITDIPRRSDVRLARAPQSFFLQDIMDAHKKALADGKNDFIDSCSMMRYYGKQLHLVLGPQENIKVTTQDDFYIMRAVLDAKENSQIYGFDDE